MATFSYEALDGGGKTVKGIITAANEEVIAEKLRDMGYYPLKVKAEKAKSGDMDLLAMPIIRIFFHRIKFKHVTTFTRQLATLIDAGLPIIRCLDILTEQVESVIFKEKIQGMRSEIESGSTLSEVLERTGIKHIDGLYVSMVRAGEIGGVLEAVLAKIATFLEKRAAIISKVKSAMMYPITVLVVAGGIVMGILIFIMPKFLAIFIDLGAPIPPLTAALMTVSQILIHKTHFVIIGAVALFLVVRKANQYPAIKHQFDKMKLKVPVFGDLFRKVAIVRFAGTLSTLITAGVPILQSLDIVRDTSGNEVVARAMGDVYESVKEGESIHEPLAASKVFPPLVYHMVAVGEETGAIDQMLTKVAEAYEREVDDTIDGLTALLEPIMIVFLGTIVGTIVIALYLPLFKLSTVVGN